MLFIHYIENLSPILATLSFVGVFCFIFVERRVKYKDVIFVFIAFAILWRSFLAGASQRYSAELIIYGIIFVSYFLANLEKFFPYIFKYGIKKIYMCLIIVASIILGHDILLLKKLCIVNPYKSVIDIILNDCRARNGNDKKALCLLVDEKNAGRYYFFLKQKGIAHNINTLPSLLGTHRQKILSIIERNMSFYANNETYLVLYVDSSITPITAEELHLLKDQWFFCGHIFTNTHKKRQLQIYRKCGFQHVNIKNRNNLVNNGNFESCTKEDLRWYWRTRQLQFYKEPVIIPNHWGPIGPGYITKFISELSGCDVEPIEGNFSLRLKADNWCSVKNNIYLPCSQYVIKFAAKANENSRFYFGIKYLDNIELNVDKIFPLYLTPDDGTVEYTLYLTPDKMKNQKDFCPVFCLEKGYMLIDNVEIINISNNESEKIQLLIEKKL